MDPSERTDGELIAASRKDPHLFETVFERHHAAVVRFAIGRVGYDDAADVAAEAFVRAFERRHRFRPDQADALPWLFAITANVAKERRRRLARRHRAYARRAAMPEGDFTFDLGVAERVDAARQAERLVEALRRLSDDEYRVLMLAAHSHLSYAEMAVVLGVPIGTVRSRLSRARARIRELVEAEEPIQTAPD